MLTCLSHNLLRNIWLKSLKYGTTPSCKCRPSATHDTIMQVQTVRDTIYETRVVTKYEPMLAKAEASPTFEEEDDTSSEQKACSMLCDDIPYELLAAGR